MKTIKGFVEDDLDIEEDTEIMGDVTGDVSVGECTLVVTGTVKGTIYANEGSVLDLIGEADEVRADASDVSISGTVYGDVIYRDTYIEIDENATINGDVIDENEDGGITRYDDYDYELQDGADDDEDSKGDDDEDLYGLDDDDYDDDPYDDDDYNDDGF